jgi:hypothetical protein
MTGPHKTLGSLLTMVLSAAGTVAVLALGALLQLR